LSILDIRRPYKLFVDASDYAVAGILAQQVDEGHDRPVAFASVKLNNSQRLLLKRRHLLAAIYALQKLRRWIFWCPVRGLYFNHNPLTYLTQASPRSSKPTRWALALQDYNLQFHYKEGRNNAAAELPLSYGTASLAVTKFPKFLSLVMVIFTLFTYIAYALFVFCSDKTRVER